MFSTLGAVSTLAIPLGMAVYGWLLWAISDSKTVSKFNKLFLRKKEFFLNEKSVLLHFLVYKLMGGVIIGIFQV
jgi:hypothetical protein